MSDLEQKRDHLLALIKGYESCAVAFSAGVDSTVVAKAAYLALGDRSLAVTANSPSLASGELEQARQLADLIGIRHVVVETNELSREQYAANRFDRCYHCKSELYLQMDSIADRFSVAVLVNGANLDDWGDHRPGLRAARENRIQSPLAACGISKDEVRQLARQWQLPVWDKPAMPCLSSRIAYGEEVTPRRLSMIDRAEQILRAQGFRQVRVRYHRGDLARIEIESDQLPQLFSGDRHPRVVEQLLQLGFRFVTVDLQGFRSGSLNAMVPVEQLERGSADPG